MKKTTKLTELRNSTCSIYGQKLLRLSGNNDTWQVKTKIYLTVINHLNIASIKQLHEKAVYWKIQGLKIRFG